MKILARFCTILGAVISQPALANGGIDGQISHIYVSNGIAMVKMTAPVSGKPGCATNINWDFAFPASDQATFSLLLTARASGSTLRITGNGACTTWSDVENLSFALF